MTGRESLLPSRYLSGPESNPQVSACLDAIEKALVGVFTTRADEDEAHFAAMRSLDVLRGLCDTQ